MGRASRETWAKRVERWKDSGLTAEEYSAELGINAQSLSWWKWRLSSQSGEPKSATQPRRAISRATPAAASTPPLTFVEMTAAVPAEPLEVVLPSSIRIRVPSSFEASTLGRLLDVLEQRR